MANNKTTYSEAGDELEIRPPTRRKAPLKYLPDEQERRVKTYPLTSTEIMTISVLSPGSSLLLGWGVNVWLSWCSAPPDSPIRSQMLVMWLGCVVIGSFLQLWAWGLFARILWESRKTKPPKPVISLPPSKDPENSA